MHYAATSALAEQGSARVSLGGVGVTRKEWDLFNQEQLTSAGSTSGMQLQRTLHQRGTWYAYTPLEHRICCTPPEHRICRRFGQLESVTNQLFNLLNKHEHLAGPVAALAAHPALRSDDSRLVRTEILTSARHAGDRMCTEGAWALATGLHRLASHWQASGVCVTVAGHVLEIWTASDPEVLPSLLHVPAKLGTNAPLLTRTNELGWFWAQAVELLRAVASVDPREYEAQMTRTAAAVRTVGAFIAELAERCVPLLSSPPACHMPTMYVHAVLPRRDWLDVSTSRICHQQPVTLHSILRRLQSMRHWSGRM